MKITNDNYLQLLENPDDLASAFSGNTATIVETALDVFKTIFDAIKEALANGGHFRKDVKAFINLQRQWDDKFLSEFNSLKEIVEALQKNVPNP